MSPPSDEVDIIQVRNDVAWEEIRQERRVVVMRRKGEGENTHVDDDAVGLVGEGGDEDRVVRGGHARRAGSRIAPAEWVPPVAIGRLRPLDRWGQRLRSGP